DPCRQRFWVSGLDALAVGSLPTPGTRTVTTTHNALFEDLRDDLAVASQQRLCRAHLSAERQLAFGKTVGAVARELTVLSIAVLGRRQVGFGPASAVGTFVHLSARPKIPDFRVLRCTEWTRVEAVAAADAQIFGVQHNAVCSRIEAVDWAYGGA